MICSRASACILLNVRLFFVHPGGKGFVSQHIVLWEADLPEQKQIISIKDGETYAIQLLIRCIIDSYAIKTKGDPERTLNNIGTGGEWFPSSTTMPFSIVQVRDSEQPACWLIPDSIFSSSGATWCGTERSRMLRKVLEGFLWDTRCFGGSSQLAGSIF